MIRSTKDFWTGVLYLFFGVTAILVARDYGMGTGGRMGPAYFPTVLGGLLAVAGVIAVIRSFITPGTPVGAFAFKGLTLIILSVIIFGFIVRSVGLAVALPLLVIMSASASKRFRWRTALIMAAVLTTFCILVFVEGLGIPLPIVGPWLGG